MRLFLKVLIRVYRFFISPLLGKRCRYHPSCSVYMEHSLDRFGVFKGLRYGLRRLSRCTPFHDGGYDPVSDTEGSCHG